MASVINTNVMSLNAQRNLTQSQSAMSTSLQRLSSGLRINSAKDDAAGLAIANRFTSQINGMNQAARNANDGISLAQTAEGALQQTTNNLQRMRQLAVQSSNSTNTASDRASLDSEYQQLLAENDRIATTTSFNGLKVLDGSLGSSAFQVGANVGETITVNLSSSMRNTSIGSSVNQTLTLTSTDIATAETAYSDIAVVVNSVAIAEPLASLTGIPNTNGRSSDSALQIAAAINLQSGTTGVKATANEATVTSSAANAAAFDNSTATSVYTLNINGEDIFSQDQATGDTTAKTVSQMVDLINVKSSSTGVVATIDGGDLKLTAADGRNIEITESAGTANIVAGYFGGGAIVVGTDDVAEYKGTIDLSSTSDLSASVTGAATFGTKVTSNVASSNILDVSGSNSALQNIDSALADVDSFRGNLGAIQARFESAVASLSTSVENLSAARSRVMDADFALETANMTKNQILQQAGTAMVSQANSMPQSVLSLLG